MSELIVLAQVDGEEVVAIGDSELLQRGAMTYVKVG